MKGFNIVYFIVCDSRWFDRRTLAQVVSLEQSQERESASLTINAPNYNHDIS